MKSNKDAKHSKTGFNRPQELSEEMANFMRIDPPIGSVQLCTKFIGAYHFLYGQTVGSGVPPRLAELFRNKPEMIKAKKNIGFGAELQKMGLISREVVRGQWDDTKFNQIEALVDDTTALIERILKEIKELKEHLDSKICDETLARQQEDVKALVVRWNELGLTPIE